MGLPECGDDDFGVLPPSDVPYQATIADLKLRFVDEAPQPQRERRGLILQAAELHISMVRRLFADHEVRIWLNGGFVTHKRWKAPRDADLAVLVPSSAISKATLDAALPLWTLSNVTAQLGEGGPTLETPKLHTGLGLTDAYVVPVDRPMMVEMMRRRWSSVKGPDGKLVDGMEKGFVEVIG